MSVHASPATARHSGSRVLTDAGVLLAQLGVVASALVIWLFAGLTFFGEPLHPGDYLHMVVAFALAAGCLVAGTVPAVALRCRAWVRVTGAVLAVLCLLAALLAGVEARHAAPGEGGEVWWWPFQLFAMLPTSWPMLGLLLATPLLRGRSGPSPR